MANFINTGLWIVHDLTRPKATDMPSGGLNNNVAEDIALLSFTGIAEMVGLAVDFNVETVFRQSQIKKAPCQRIL